MSYNYLVNIPQESETWGACKVLLVRREMIHLKHIMTEIYLRKTVDAPPDHIEFLTQKIRRIHNLPREYRASIEHIKDIRDNSFFRQIELYRGIKSIIALDFDGTITATKFHKLYTLCVERGKVHIVTANPTVSVDWFDKKGLPRPHIIHACRGAEKKRNCLTMLAKQFDAVFYVDNETKYLDWAWIHSIKTFHWTQNKIKYYTRKTK